MTSKTPTISTFGCVIQISQKNIYHTIFTLKNRKKNINQIDINKFNFNTMN